MPSDIPTQHLKQALSLLSWPQNSVTSPPRAPCWPAWSVSTGPPRAGCRLTFLPRVSARPLLLSSHRCCNSSFRTIFPNPSSQQLQATLLGWDPLFTFLARETQFQHCASIVCHPPSSLYVGGICLSEVGVVWRTKQQQKKTKHPHCCLFFFLELLKTRAPESNSSAQERQDGQRSNALPLTFSMQFTT